MANIVINNQNLGPVIQTMYLPETNINPDALYKLVSRKFDMVDGHGKDNDKYPVGFYKPAAGTRWSATQVVYGSGGVYMDGYSSSPNVKMRAGTEDWRNPVPCSADESSGIWYYDFARNNVYFAWHAVAEGGVDYYSPEELDRVLGVNYLGVYTYVSGQWIAIGGEEQCTFLGTANATYGTLSDTLISKVGNNTYFVTGKFKLTTSLNPDSIYNLIQNFKVGPTVRTLPYNEVGYAYTNNTGIIGNFLINIDGKCWFTFDRAVSSGTEIHFSSTFMVA